MARGIVNDEERDWRNAPWSLSGAKTGRSHEGSVQNARRSRTRRFFSNGLVRPEGLEPPTLGSEGGQSTLETDSDQRGQMDMFSL